MLPGADQIRHSAATGQTPFTVIVPAHDEAAVIGRCLRSILADAPLDAQLDLIVVANGCSDQTAQVARETAPAAIVIELGEASKSAAINEGLATARNIPVLVVDADIVTSYRTLAATALALLEPGVMAASPVTRVEIAGSTRWVRSHYSVWQQLPYVTDRLIGGGIYGLSRMGLDRIGYLPPVIGDDLYVRTRFPAEERRSVSVDPDGVAVTSIQFAPRGAIDLIRIEARRLHGKRQIDSDYPTAHSGTINGARALANACRHGVALRDVAIYVTTKLLARALHAGNTFVGAKRWSRDLSTRQSAVQQAR